MNLDKKTAAALADAAKNLRKSADVLDKIASGDMNEGDGENKAKKRSICD